MKRLLPIALLFALGLSAFALAGCGPNGVDDLKEGESFELGDLRYDVVFTRLLNPADVEDRDYLTGQPAPGPDEDYMGVFVLIKNEGEDPVTLPVSGFTVTSTDGATFEPLDSDSLFALDLGATIEPGKELPELDTVAAAGPTQGSMLLYLVDQTATENRPLKLTVPGPDEDATVELDL